MFSGVRFRDQPLVELQLEAFTLCSTWPGAEGTDRPSKLLRKVPSSPEQIRVHSSIQGLLISEASLSLALISSVQRLQHESTLSWVRMISPDFFSRQFQIVLSFPLPQQYVYRHMTYA
jgi:hypothetical protein